MTISCEAVWLYQMHTIPVSIVESLAQFLTNCYITTASLPSPPAPAPDLDARSASPAETGETGSFHTPDILDTSSEMRDEPDFSVVVCNPHHSLVPRPFPSLVCLFFIACMHKWRKGLGERVMCITSGIALVYTDTLCPLRFLNLKVKPLLS